MTDERGRATPWVLCARPRPGAALRLFCLPHAGGSAAAYVPWSRLAPDSVEIVGLQPPGRGRRLKETPFNRMRPLVESAAKAASPLMDRPYAIYGHSLGALTGFALAHQLGSAGFPPAHLFVSGARAAHVPAGGRPIHALSEPEFTAEIRRLGGTPGEILQHAELMSALVPALRADFNIYETYAAPEDQTLACPITAFGGQDDPLVSPEELDAWRVLTASGFRLHLLLGGHMLPGPSVEAMLSSIWEALEALSTNDGARLSH